MHYYINIMSIIYWYIILWRTIFKYYLFIGGIIWLILSALISTFILPLASICEFLYWHKLDLNIKILNLIWLSSLYVPRDLSFFSSQFFILNSDGWLVYFLTNLLFLDIPLLYYYIKLRSSICFFVFLLFVIISDLICGELLETL